MTKDEKKQRIVEKVDFVNGCQLSDLYLEFEEDLVDELLNENKLVTLHYVFKVIQ